MVAAEYFNIYMSLASTAAWLQRLREPKELRALAACGDEWSLLRRSFVAGLTQFCALFNVLRQLLAAGCRIMVVRLTQICALLSVLRQLLAAGCRIMVVRLTQICALLSVLRQLLAAGCRIMVVRLTQICALYGVLRQQPRGAVEHRTPGRRIALDPQAAGRLVQPHIHRRSGLDRQPDARGCAAART